MATYADGYCIPYPSATDDETQKIPTELWRPVESSSTDKHPRKTTARAWPGINLLDQKCIDRTAVFLFVVLSSATYPHWYSHNACLIVFYVADVFLGKS